VSEDAKQRVRYQASDLKRHGQAILQAVGTPDDLALIVAESLVDANLAGHDSHGVIRLTSYVAGVRSGQVQPAARPVVESLSDACARVDGAWGWGQPAAHIATDTALDLARAHGVGLVTIGRCNHIGRLGEYVEKVSRAGQIGLMVCNSPPAVAPYGGYTRLLGTNPIAWGAPRTSGKPPIVVDFATASIAEGKLRIAHAIGSKAPLGAVVDKHGQPTTNTAAFYDGGALTTFGGHKGFGLSVMAELMAGILSGTGSSSDPDYNQGNGTVLLAIDVGSFLQTNDFVAQVDALEGRLHAAPAAAGFDPILMPGEPEWRSRSERTDEGIPIPAPTVRAINDLAKELGLSPI
jgi:LDH2 family malate/lactate/ureidoglycolate dehydrogenase